MFKLINWLCSKFGYKEIFEERLVLPEITGTFYKTKIDTKETSLIGNVFGEESDGATPLSLARWQNNPAEAPKPGENWKKKELAIKAYKADRGAYHKNLIEKRKNESI